MSIMLYCLLFATVMPILAKAPLAYAQHHSGGYNNRKPRTQQASLTGFGARAKAAHENAFEALLMFLPGALATVASGQVSLIAQSMAVTFIISRVAYLACYWWDWHLARSAFWLVGFICSVALIVQAIPA